MHLLVACLRGDQAQALFATATSIVMDTLDLYINRNFCWFYRGRAWVRDKSADAHRAIVSKKIEKPKNSGIQVMKMRAEWEGVGCGEGSSSSNILGLAVVKVWDNRTKFGKGCANGLVWCR